MEQFKIKEDGFKEIRKTMLARAIPLSVLAVLGAIAINYYNPSAEKIDMKTIPFLMLLIAGTMTFGLYRGIKLQRKIFESYVLTIDKTGFTRTQHNTPTIVISKENTVEIIKNPNGSFTIKGDSARNMISVPKQIGNYERLEELLSEIGQISNKESKSLLQRLSIPLSIVTIGLMAAVYISKNLIVVGISGTVLLALMGYSFFEIKGNKNIDLKTKRGMWWLLLVAVSIAGTMYFKFMGWEP